MDMEAWEKALTQLGINLKAPLMAFNNAEKIKKKFDDRFEKKFGGQIFFQNRLSLCFLYICGKNQPGYIEK